MTVIVCLQLLKLPTLETGELMALTFQTFSMHPIHLVGQAFLRPIHLVLSVALFVWQMYGSWDDILAILYTIWLGLICIDYLMSPTGIIFYVSFATFLILNHVVRIHYAPTDKQRILAGFILGFPIWSETLLILYKLFTVDKLPAVTLIQSFFIYGNFVSVMVGLVSLVI